MLLKDLEKPVVEQADAQPAWLPGADLHLAVIGAAPVAVERRQRKGRPPLRVVHLLRKRRIDALHDGIEGRVRQLAGEYGQNAIIQRGQVEDEGA
ncbi:MAG: hypothetical protein IPM07_18815 [Anaerolineales bacterium]|nr:hypothetical protein [Anaerolineales bacterium]